MDIQSAFTKLLSTIRLKYDGHPSREKGMCLMEAVAYIAGEEHSDQPKCTTPALTTFGITVNDKCGESTEGNRLRDTYLKPVIPHLLNTSTPAMRKMHRDRFAEKAHNTKHDKKVEKFLVRRMKEEFGLLDPYLSSDEHVWKILTARRGEELENAVRKCATILREGCDYTKELLGDKVDAPVTIYASEYVLPGHGDNYADDITEQSREQEVHIHHG